jgi:hypothetical protein
MKKIFFTFLFLLQFISTNAQDKGRKSYYGGVFTPKGDLKVLIVPVIFKDNPQSNPTFVNSAHNIEGWKVGNLSNLPDCINPQSGNFPRWLYNSPEDFEKFKDSSFYNDSKMFYHISKGQFRFMADVFRDSSGNPITVEIDPEGGRDWSHMNKMAMDEMRKQSPDFDFAAFDNRKNNPQYLFDNSENPKGDKVVDYIVFIYRYSPNWSVQPALGMSKWSGSGGGFASPSGIMLENYNGYKFSEGFTMMWASGVFFHELAHTLYNLPHLWGTNSTVGEYFYRPSVGWGATSSAGLFQIPSAWETWFLGYNDLIADIKGPEDLKNSSVFELRDYVQTGDAMRIKLPFTENQYLWLEYHAIEHPFDRHVWSGQKIGEDELALPAKGVYAYLEQVSDSYDKIPGVLSPLCNAIKPINAAGNYDYTYDDETPKLNAWGNKLYKFKKVRENPISGTNPFFYYRADFNKDGIIGLDKNYNGARNEGEAIMCEEVSTDSFANLYNCFGVYNTNQQGRPASFLPGDYLGLNSNPLLSSFAKYNDKVGEMEPVFLTGLSVKFLKSEGSAKLSISFGETKLDKNCRWTGSIVLHNISNDGNADLEILKGKQLILDKSGTVNRHLKTEEGDFISKTKFLVKSDACIILRRGSKIQIEKDAILEFEAGAQIILEKKSKITVKNGGVLLLNNAKLVKHKKAVIKNFESTK